MKKTAGPRGRRRKYLQPRAMKRSPKERAEKLAKSMAMMCATLESTTDAILVTDETNRVTWFNEKYVRMWQVPPEIMATQDADRLRAFVGCQLKNPAGYLARLREIETSAPVESFDLLENADGRVFERNSTIQLVNGRSVGRVWSFREVTQRIRAEDGLAAEKKVLEQIAAGVPLHTVLDTLVRGVEAQSCDGMICSVLLLDESAGRLRHGAAPGLPVDYNRSVDGVQIGPHVGSCGSAAYARQPVYATDIATDPHWVGYLPLARQFGLGSCCSTPVFSSEGVLLGTVAMYYRMPHEPSPHDRELIRMATHLAGIVIERARAEEALRAAKLAAESASQAKGVFLANMSHEIRTPMSAILGFSQLLLREPDLPARQRQSLETINRAGEHLLRLINDILEMSKIEAGRVTLAPTNFDLHLLLDDLEGLFRPRIEAHHLRFSVERASDIPRCIKADEIKLRQIFINLIGNAVKFTESGSIVVRLQAQYRLGKSLSLRGEVEDTGCGIDATELPKLFRQFEQTESGQRSGSGTGLGLAISREFARLMGGDMQVTSKLGRGTTFRFEITVEEGDVVVPHQMHEPRRVTGLRGGQDRIRILAVDDKDENRELLRQLLRPIGFEIRTVANGSEALNALAEYSPNLILLDLRMPGPGGCDVIRQIRAQPASGKTPIVVITASAFEENRRAVIAAGGDDFIGKPLRERELFDKIAHFTGAQYLYAGDPMETPSRPGVGRE